MNTHFKTILVVFPLVILAGISFVVMSFIAANNMAVSYEKGIQAQYEQNINLRSKMVNSLMEASQVPEMYKNDFKEVLTSVVEGTYGSGGSKAVMQWIKERNIDYDSSLYGKLQTMIESNRADFAFAQEKLIDKKRAYKTALGRMPGGAMMRMLGFPRIKFSDYKTIADKSTVEAFKEGTDTALKLR